MTHRIAEPVTTSTIAPARPGLTLLGLALLGMAILLGGCAKESVPPASFRITSAEYDAYFDAAREALRDHHFDLERVDARSGVITTRPVAAAGWATPWIDHASTSKQATNDLIHRNRRIASVRFSPVQTETGVARPIDPVSEDLRAFDGTIEVSVSVVLEEVYRSGRRVSPASIRLSSFTEDPRSDAIGAQQLRTRTVGTDSALASRLANWIIQTSQTN